MNMARHKQNELPLLTEAREAELKALAKRPDSEIDYSDIPPLDETFWARAIPNPFFKPVRFGRAGLAQESGQGLPDQDECHLA
jgi:hypothetical protein